MKPGALGRAALDALSGVPLFMCTPFHRKQHLRWGATDADVGETKIPAAATNVTQIAAGGTFPLALKSDGTVVGWGDNTYGQATPPSGLKNVVEVSAAGVHSLALTSDGTVVAWGGDPNGEITFHDPDGNTWVLQERGYGRA